MPYAIIIIGALFMVLGWKGTYCEFFSLVRGDFTGPGNFVYWIIAIGILGGLGYVPGLQGLSRAFLGLVLLGMFLKQGTGFFSQFQSTVQGFAPGASVTATGAMPGSAPLPGTSLPMGVP